MVIKKKLDQALSELKAAEGSFTRAKRDAALAECERAEKPDALHVRTEARQCGITANQEHSYAKDLSMKYTEARSQLYVDVLNDYRGAIERALSEDGFTPHAGWYCREKLERGEQGYCPVSPPSKP